MRTLEWEVYITWPNPRVIGAWQNQTKLDCEAPITRLSTWYMFKPRSLPTNTVKSGIDAIIHIPVIMEEASMMRMAFCKWCSPKCSPRDVCVDLFQTDGADWRCSWARVSGPHSYGLQHECWAKPKPKPKPKPSLWAHLEVSKPKPKPSLRAHSEVSKPKPSLWAHSEVSRFQAKAKSPSPFRSVECPPHFWAPSVKPEYLELGFPLWFLLSMALSLYHQGNSLHLHLTSCLCLWSLSVFRQSCLSSSPHGLHLHDNPAVYRPWNGLHSP